MSWKVYDFFFPCCCRLLSVHVWVGCVNGEKKLCLRFTTTMLRVLRPYAQSWLWKCVYRLKGKVNASFPLLYHFFFFFLINTSFLSRCVWEENRHRVLLWERKSLLLGWPSKINTEVAHAKFLLPFCGGKKKKNLFVFFHFVKLYCCCR